MKKVEAIIRSSKFEDVKEALEESGIRFFTFLEVKGHGMEKNDEITYRGVPYDSGYIPRLKLEVVVKDKQLNQVIDTISSTARTGKIGDGKIIVTTVETFIRVRTGESAEAAL
ncbi:MAG: P-II family nitrogen regulator [Bacteroidetes bacterium]|nr:P-II family nitrogen regulator [Bacteroidota bacterium]